MIEFTKDELAFLLDACEKVLDFKKKYRNQDALTQDEKLILSIKEKIEDQNDTTKS